MSSNSARRWRSLLKGSRGLSVVARSVVILSLSKDDATKESRFTVFVGRNPLPQRGLAEGERFRHLLSYFPATSNRHHAYNAS